MGEVELFTLRLCQSDVYAPFLQVSEQCRMGEFAHLQMLETRFGCPLTKRERHRTNVWRLLRYFAKQVRHIVRTVKLLRQSDDVAALACSEVVPLIEVSVHLERGFRFLTERGFIPQAVSLLLYGRITQTLQIVRNFDLFCFLDVHDIISMDLMMTVKTLI